MDIDRLKLASYCPLCGAKPVQVDARVLGGSGDAQLLHVTCRRCAAGMLTLTLVGPGSSGAVGLVTDLSAEDAVRFADRPSLSTDDALRLHELLARAPAEWIPAGPLPADREATKRPRTARLSVKKDVRATRQASTKGRQAPSGKPRRSS